MTYPHGGASQIWRDGGDSAYNPKKPEIRDWGAAVESAVGALEAQAFAADPIYEGTAAGLAATPEGDQFKVESSDADIAFDVYIHDAGPVATLIASVPSAVALSAKADAAAVFPPHFDASAYDTFNYTNADALNATVTVDGDKTTIAQVTARTFGYTGTLEVGARDLPITVEATVNAASSAVGVQFTNGTDRCALYWALNSGGRVYLATALGSVDLIGISVGTFTTDDVVTFEIFVEPEPATAQVVMRKNGDLVGTYGLSNVPLGVVGYVVAGGANLTFRTLGEAVTQKEEARESVVNSQLLTLPDRRILRAHASFLSDVQRTVPSLFSASPAGSALLADTGFQAFKKANSAGFFTNLEPSDFNELIEGERGVTTIYVDAISGSDNAAGTEADPLASLNDAIARVSAGGVGNGASDRALIKAKGGDYFGAESFNSTGGVNRRLSIVSWDGVPVVSSPHIVGLSWALSTGTTYTASLTGFTSSVPAVWDARSDQLDTNADWKNITVAASQAACESTPGTYFVGGPTIHLNLADGRAPDADVRVYPFNVGNFGYWVDGGVIYLEGIRMLGGTKPFFSSVANGLQDTQSMRLFAQDCEFSYGQGDNVVLNGDVTSVLKRCVTTFAKTDGFDYHRHAFGGVPARGIEIDCIGRSCGLTPNATNNSTMHDRGAIIRVGGDYHNCLERSIHDIEGVTTNYPAEYANAHTVSWNLGCKSHDGQNPTTAANWRFGLSNSDRLYAWLDDCTSDGDAGHRALYGESGDEFEIHTSNFDAGGGVIEAGIDVSAYDPTVA